VFTVIRELATATTVNKYLPTCREYIVDLGNYVKTNIYYLKFS